MRWEHETIHQDAEGLLELFFNRDTFGRGLPERQGSNGKMIVGPWRDTDRASGEHHYAQISAEILKCHISGTLDHFHSPAMTLTYDASQNGETSKWTAIDLDVAGPTHASLPRAFSSENDAFAAAMRLAQEAKLLGVAQPWIERTKSGGYRMWMFYAEPISRDAARNFGKLLVANAELHKDTEVFPAPNPMGVFLPYWGYQAESRQVMVDLNGNSISLHRFVIEALQSRVVPELIDKAVAQAPAPETIKARAVRPERELTMVNFQASPLAGGDAPARWAAQLAHCAHLHEIVQGAENGSELSYQEWFALATHLHVYGDFGEDEFHRISMLDPRYDQTEADAMFHGIHGGPQNCSTMGCDLDPQEDCSLPDGKENPITFGWRLEQENLDRPQIQVNLRQLRDVSADVVASLVESNDPPTLFVRGGKLVRVKSDGKGFVVVEDHDEKSLRQRCGEAANYVTIRIGKEGELIPSDAYLPLDVVRDVTALPAYPAKLPRLSGVVTTPVISRAGDVEDVPGYLPTAELFFAPPEGEQWRAQYFDPTRENVEKIVSSLFATIFAGFPFADGASRAHMLAAMLQPILRPAISGPTPLFLIDAPTRGTGKSLLAETIIVATNPYNCAPMTAPGAGKNAEDEWRKKITSALRNGASHVWIDNLAGYVESSSLAAVLSATQWSDRVLGKSEEIKLPNYATWIATSNNAIMHEDIATRAVVIRLDAECERPEARTGFKVQNPPAYTIAKRDVVLGGLLTLVRYWVSQGRPLYAGKATSRMPGWLSVVGGVLECIGMPEIMTNYDAVTEGSSPEQSAWREFVAQWGALYGSRDVSIRKDLYELAFGKEDEFGRSNEPGALSDVLYATSYNGRVTRLGQSLQKERDRVYGDWKIKVHKGRTTTYKLERVSSVVDTDEWACPVIEDLNDDD